MKRLLQTLTIVILGLTALVVSIHTGQAEWLDGEKIHLPRIPVLSFQTEAADASDLLSSACAVKPIARGNKYRQLPAIRGTVPLSRFRSESNLSNATKQANPAAIYKPREVVALAHPTNFGRRFTQDIAGRPTGNQAIVVLHETVGSAQSTIGYFQTPHPRDNDQVSYHTLIREDGSVVYLVPPDRRAFGAGNSVFSGTNGDETIKTNPSLPPSVNNFAYHISLVTPPDGRGNGTSHSGYTQAQYQSLAWLVAKTGVPDNRITTHRLVDRSRQRRDPRSFNSQYFFRLLYLYPRTADISMQCTLPAIPQEE